MSERPPTPDGSYNGAVMSACGRYRHLLWRSLKPFEVIDPNAYVMFVMLNPSTADARSNDQTIYQCIRFGEYWGYSMMIVANAYDFRATDPAELAAAGYPASAENDPHWLFPYACRADTVVCAWGANIQQGRQAALRLILPKSKHLGLTKAGNPRHPLYLPVATRLNDWR